MQIWQQIYDMIRGCSFTPVEAENLHAIIRDRTRKLETPSYGKVTCVLKMGNDPQLVEQFDIHEPDGTRTVIKKFSDGSETKYIYKK